jgi:pimeloyl-ACP methyl ester carboxylesterase
VTTTNAPAGADFKEGFVEADGFRIRYLEAGSGDAHVIIHGGGGVQQYYSHDALAKKRRVVLLEVPGFGNSAANDRTQSMAELGNTMAQAIANLGIERYSLQGNSFGGKVSLWLAVQHADKLDALVLMAPAAIRLEAQRPPAPGTFRLYNHPERVPPQAEVTPEMREKSQGLTRRIMGGPRDADLEARMRELNVPVLLLFGTEDKVLPPEVARIYPEILPTCNIMFVYDAGHEIEGDRPEAFVAVVEDFLDRKAGFLVNAKSGLIHP